MPTNLPIGVRVFCGLTERVLPADLVRDHGREINEAFLDLYGEARSSSRPLARARLFAHELRALAITAYRERGHGNGQRDRFLALRARPRTTSAPSGLARKPTPHSPRSPRNWLETMLDNLLQDVRYSVRTLIQSPVFTAVAVLTLALGIGANTAVFSVVNTVLLQPLPYEEAERLVVVWTDFGSDLPQNWVSGPEFLEIQEHNTSLESFAVMSTDTSALTGDGGEPTEILQGTVSGSFFDVLRVQPQSGRLIAPQDDEGEETVAVVTDSFWRSRMGARADAVGSTLILDGAPFEIVGVLPPGFRVYHPNVSDPAAVQLYTPMQPTYGTQYEDLGRGSHFLLGFGMAGEDTTVAQVQADMDRVAARMYELNPDYYDFEGWGLTVYSLHADLVETTRSALVVLLSAVAFVLLIACVNVANLQLTRAAGRGREIALRSAVGAGRKRLVQQLLTEALVLAFVGGAIGLALAYWLVEVLAVIAPSNLPRADAIGLDGTALLFVGAITLVTAVTFGVAPVLFATRTDLVDALKEGGRSASSGRSGNRLRAGLVVAEVALALVLLVGAGLMLRSLRSMLNADPGYRTESVLTLRVSLPQPKYDAPTSQTFWDEVLTRVRGLPGVIEAGAINSLPLSRSGGSGTTLADHSERVETPPDMPYPFIEADRRVVTTGYFETLGVRFLAGRAFSAQDSSEAGLVAIVDEEFARRFWGDEDALGRRVAVSWNRDADTGEFTPIWREVIGVVAHSRHRNVREVGREQVYTVVNQRPSYGMHIALRTDGDPTALAAAVRAQVWDIDPDQPVSDVATMNQRVAAVVEQPRFTSMLFTAFAGVALVLSAIGLYGVISFSVGQRTNEIGVRMALGASQSSVRGMVLRQGLTVIGTGLVIGIAFAVVLTRLITSMLYAVSPTDPATYLAVAAVLVSVAVLACLVPAVRATRVEPVAALRER